jgi:Putative zinc dependent peptidase (DUF5700)
LTLIFTIHHCDTIAQELNKQKIDFSSVDAFWGIAEKIRNEMETEADWDYLFLTGYYQFYNNWGRRKYIQNTLVTALSPKKNLERDSLIKINDFNSYVLKQIISTYADKDQLKTIQKNLTQSNLLKKIVKRAKEFLPKDLNSQTYEPFIYFGVFQPDANASDKSIAIDLKLYYELADPIGLIAHEYHHFLTMNYRKKFKEIENDSSSLIMKSVSQLQLEGIADMIDKDKFLNSDGRGFPSVLSRNFKKFHKDPLPTLQKMDSLLVAISKDPSTTKRNSEAIFNLFPLGGHPHGFYMAKTILKVYGKRKLLSTVKNPFDFIRVFNNAYLKLNDTAIFSEEAIKFLSYVENTHSF